MIADRDICLDKTATKLVAAGSVESAFQLVPKGREIPEDEVARLGLYVDDEGKVVQRSNDSAPPAWIEHVERPERVKPADSFVPVTGDAAPSEQPAAGDAGEGAE